MRVILNLSVAIMFGGMLALPNPAIAGNNAPSQALCAAAAVMSANAHAKGKTNQYADTILVMCAAATPAQPANPYGPTPPPATPTDQYGNPLPQQGTTPTDQYGNPLPQQGTTPTTPTDQYGNPLPQQGTTPTDQYGNPPPQGSPSPAPTDQYGNPLPSAPMTTPTAGSPSLNDFAGNWLITADKTFLMQLYVTGTTVTGTYDATGRNGTLTNGMLNGDTLNYSWVQTGTIKLNGTGTFRLTTPNHMDGTWTTGTYSGTWSGDRQ